MEYRLEILSYYPASPEGKKRVCVCVCVCSESTCNSGISYAWKLRQMHPKVTPLVYDLI